MDSEETQIETLHALDVKFIESVETFIDSATEMMMILDKSLRSLEDQVDRLDRRVFQLENR